jgi:hypothetical protein
MQTLVAEWLSNQERANLVEQCFKVKRFKLQLCPLVQLNKQSELVTLRGDGGELHENQGDNRGGGAGDAVSMRWRHAYALDSLGKPHCIKRAVAGTTFG